jgi:hypothetical protein
MSKNKAAPQPSAKPKKTVLDVPGRKKYSSFRDYVKDLENTLAELHVATARGGK